MVLVASVEPSSGFPNRWETVVIGACCCCVALIIGTFLFLYWYFRCRSPVGQAMGVKEPLVSRGNDTLVELIDECSQYTGSGSGEFCR